MKAKAIGLFSGGLDSIIAVKILQDQGLHVEGLAFETPFFGSAAARKSAEAIDMPLRVIDFTEDHLAMLKAPRYGYGKNMNPCIDCHALMLEKAGLLMAGEGWDFLFTGEVLGQRPKSQTGQSLRLVAKLSGYDGYILRPLSALLLPETIPEMDGRVDRQRLLDIQGRSRKRQIMLAEKYAIKSYSSPGGGCLLTDPVFSHRLKDLFSACKNPSIRDIELLKVGRHLRINEDFKIVVGRNKIENDIIEGLATAEDSLVDIPDVPSPIVMVPGCGDEETLRQAAEVCAFYSDAPKDVAVEAVVRRGGQKTSLMAMAAERDYVRTLMIERPSRAEGRG
ncbi:MAG: tRNA 4-thiouridine(8) synthase ThiI [Syntrophales bacterium]|nr:tRNA 4-thiouridine(8) synthase ThiI [Syntrophales bacterium]